MVVHENDHPMRAAYYERQGPAGEVLQVGEIELPRPGPAEVLVRLATSGINPSDVKMRAGARGGMPFPRIVPHSDGAGVIESVGEGVDPSRVGRRVWTFNAGWGRAMGTAAEFVALPVTQIVDLPEEATFETGACLGIPAMTAHRCLFADGEIAGCAVLITGGAGAVGSAAIQLAKWVGARVITTVSGEAKAAFAKSAGADHVINYKSEEVASAVLELTNGEGVDRVVDVEFGGNLDITRRIIKPNGTIAAYGSMAEPTPKLPFYELMFKGVNLRMVLVYILLEDAREHAKRDIKAALRDGALKPPIAQTFPLDQVAKAHEAVESGKAIGNVVLKTS